MHGQSYSKVLQDIILAKLAYPIYILPNSLPI